MLAKVKTAVGSLDRVKHVVKVLGMVNSANGFSDLMVEVFGEPIGKHARSAVGMAALPGNAPVEVEMILEVE
jgi:enamine deaminase RidA (YjgF/YER057c/UK114 family)